MQFITSILDNDKYKFTMQQTVLEHYHDINVSYLFINRGKTRFNKIFQDLFIQQVQLMTQLSLSDDEYNWLKETQCELKPMYLEYLRNFRFDLSELKIIFSDKGELNISIEGPWHHTILWEVPLMALICECYTKSIKAENDPKKYEALISDKRKFMEDVDCKYADFGTRRRFSNEIHDIVVKTLSKSKNCVGTSNMHFAMKYGTKAIGTMAHELFMGISALETLRYANRKTMQRWYQTYNGRLGIVLCDTYGLDDFLKHFDNFNARLFDGVRHDSGDPFIFADKIISHYESLGINPTSKTIVFSDGLTPYDAAKIKNHCANRIQCSFGIGTNFSNDTKYSLNIVIKLRTVDGIDVVKLSDNPIKATGEESAIAIAMSVFHGKKIALCE